MSGGHFDYRESYLEYIAEQLAQDIQYNDVEYDISRSPDKPYGFQHRPETIRYLELMVDELFRLNDLLKTYDYAVSGDSSEEEFLTLARQAFSKKQKKNLIGTWCKRKKAMHFYYLDEAGCTGEDLNNDQQPIFVLGGVSVRDEGWNKTQEDFAKILSDYFEGRVPAGFELHAEELLSPNGHGPFLGHERERRSLLAKKTLSLLNTRSHDVHLFAIEKQKVAREACATELNYNPNVPYLLAYDYLLTHINWFVKEKLGRSARGMLIIDAKEQFHPEIESVTRYRRFEDTAAHRIKWIVEFSYPVDSEKNPMVQLSDLVVFCAKKFFEIEAGYRDNYPAEAKRFFAECFEIIDGRNPKKTLVNRNGRNMENLNNYLNAVQAKPSRQWKRKYGLA